MNTPNDKDGTRPASRMPRRLPTLGVPGTALTRLRARVLDPADAVLRPEDRERFPNGVHPSVYVEDVLLVREDEAGSRIGLLKEAAAVANHKIVEEWRSPYLDRLREVAKERKDDRELQAALSRLDQVHVRLARSQDGPQPSPDAWEVLQAARGKGFADAPGAVSLSHVVTAAGRGWGDGVGQGWGDGVGQGWGDGVGQGWGDGVGQGWGDGVGTPMGGPSGRGPVVWSAANPRVAGAAGPGVVLLDTGVGRHPWFPGLEPGTTSVNGDGDGIVRDLQANGLPVGLRLGQAEDPEYSGVTVDTISGRLDRIAGHGTFIAGIVRQHCPEATILSVPVMMGDGACAEDEVIRALTGVYAYHREVQDGTTKGAPVDVVTMSFGYYHETPGAFDDEAGLAAAIQALTDAGICVVAAAGNRSSDVPFYPAALNPTNGLFVSVGSRNPGVAIVSAYSNTGDWVRSYRPGTNIVSTMPTTINAAVRASMANAPVAYPPRSSVDPDDYSGGFGVWSGTSFAAPAFAGQVAAKLAGGAHKSATQRRDVITELLEEKP